MILLGVLAAALGRPFDFLSLLQTHERLDRI
jgi:hypothetical protein